MTGSIDNASRRIVVNGWCYRCVTSHRVAQWLSWPFSPPESVFDGAGSSPHDSCFIFSFLVERYCC